MKEKLPRLYRDLSDERDRVADLQRWKQAKAQQISFVEAQLAKTERIQGLDIDELIDDLGEPWPRRHMSPPAAGSFLYPGQV